MKELQRDREGEETSGLTGDCDVASPVSRNCNSTSQIQGLSDSLARCSVLLDLIHSLLSIQEIFIIPNIIKQNRR